METSKESIERVCEATKRLLIKKNREYGNSALEPIGVFGDGNAVVSLGARMDDKLMRLKSLGIGSQTIDTLFDLHGYITLLIIAIERSSNIRSEDLIVGDDSNTSKAIQE